MAVIRPLSDDECLGVLSEVGWGRLATVSDAGPYAVPMLYVVAERSLRFYTLPGRKLDALRQHPNGVTMEVDDIATTAAWRSVIVVGRFTETDATVRQSLVEAFSGRAARFCAEALRDVQEPSAIFGKIEIEQLSGRAMQPDAG